MSNTKSPTTKPANLAANNSKASTVNAKPALSSLATQSNPSAKNKTNASNAASAKGGAAVNAKDRAGDSVPYQVGDEISFASPHGMLYGTIRRVITDSDTVAVEIEFEDGHRELKKARDRALGLLRRASGKSEVQERQEGQGRRMLRDYDVDEVRRLEQRRGSRR